MSTSVDIRYWGFFFLGLLSLLLLMGGLALWWNTRHQSRSSERLQAWVTTHGARPGLADAGRRWRGESPRLQQWLARLPGIEHYDQLLLHTGWPLSSAQALLGTSALAMGVGALTALLGMGWPMAVLSALCSALCVQWVLVWRRNHRAAQLEQQLPDALSLVARSMQAGHAFSSALQIAGQESPDPMGGELRGVFSAIQYGQSANEALRLWAQRMAGQDVRMFVIAVRIQSETGGNLAELLHQTAALIRERQKLRGMVRVLSAEGRISAVILTQLPFALAALLALLNPDFMSQLWTDPLGIRMLALALVLMGIGVVWMWQMARIQP